LGHKVHPTGFRLGVIKDWQSKWYSETHYAEYVLEDNKLRESIKSKYPEAGISLIEIDRQAKDVTITLHTARPGIVIGRGGQRVDEMRQYLERLISKKIRLNIQEVRQPELDAYLVARSIAEQIERRVAYRRAMKQAIFRTIQAGAKGIKVSAAGRLGNAEIARRQTSHQGQVPLHTLRADIDYGFTEAHTTLGRIGVKVWIYKGQVMPELKIETAEEKPAAAEVAPAAPPGEKPSIIEEKLKEVAAAAPAAGTEEKPARATAKAAPVARPKEKPAKPAAKAVAEVKPEERPAKPAVKAVAEVKPEEKPAKPTAKAVAEVKPEERPAKPAVKAVAGVKPEEKPAKPRAKKAVKAPEAKKIETKEAEEPAAPKKPRKKAAAKPEAKAEEPAPAAKKAARSKGKEK
jgi:small subunit ribosomal protein S3